MKSVKFLLILFLLFLSGCSREKAREPLSLSKEEKVIVYLFKDFLSNEKRVLTIREGRDSEKAEVILRELKKDGILPEGSRLYDMAFGRDGILYLNFSKEIEDSISSPLEEIRRVYSIINSFILTFPQTRAVQILVEDHPVYTFFGLLYLYRPLKFLEMEER